MTAQQTTNNAQKPRRPLAVSIFAYFHLLAGITFGIFFILTIVFYFIGQEALTVYIQNLGMKGYTPFFLIIILGITTGIALGSGIGMLMGKKWGWHLGAFYYAYNIFRNINFMFFIHLPISIFPLEALTSYINDPNLYIVKYAVRGSVFVAFYVLMNVKPIRRYFGLHLENNLTVLIIQFGVLVILTSLLSGYTV